LTLLLAALLPFLLSVAAWRCTLMQRATLGRIVMIDYPNCGENNPVFEQDEPVAVVTGVYGGRFIVEPTNSAMVLPVNMALYAHPQPRKPLTDEQIKRDFEKWAKENYVQGFELYGDSYHNGHTRNRWQGWLAAHRAIEASHGIKE
jgi:hypothetical protein